MMRYTCMMVYLRVCDCDVMITWYEGEVCVMVM